MIDIGSEFRCRREQLGLSLDDIQDEIKTRKYFIAALEENQFELLPAKVYALGLVKRYAGILGLDETLMVEEFKSQAYHNEKEEQPFSTSRRERFDFNVKNVLTGLAFLMAVILIFGYLADYMANKFVQERRNRVTQESKTYQHQNVKPKPKPKVIKGIQLTLEGEDRSWIGVTVDGNDVYQGFLNSGQKMDFKGKTKIELIVGNAQGVRAIYNGQDIGYLGDKADVVRTQFPPSTDSQQARAP
ncbi:MAG: helix-turn-helix domain-containing protein [Chitinophagales bacterium]